MYYIISFLYKNDEYYCIWFSGDEDYVLANQNHLMVFHNIDVLLKYASENCILLENESVSKYDINAIVLWLKNTDYINIDCDMLMNFWNICTDVANGTTEHFIGIEKRYNTLYEKLFCGNNILTTKNKKYIPFFSNDEIETLRDVINNGLNIIVKNLITETQGTV